MGKKATLTAASLLLASCDNPFYSTSGSMTVNLRKGSEAELAKCMGGLDITGSQTYTGSDGSQWKWLKDEDGMLSHYCRTDGGGKISAWREASRNEGATHRLKFDSSDSPPIFQTIAPK